MRDKIFKKKKKKKKKKGFFFFFFFFFFFLEVICIKLVIINVNDIYNKNKNRKIFNSLNYVKYILPFKKKKIFFFFF